MNRSIKSFTHASVFAVIAEAFRAVKIQYIVGTSFAFFSANQVMTPLVGAFGGSLAGFGLYLLRTAARIGFWGFGSWAVLGHHVPTLCASLYMSSSSKAVRVLIPVACMALFLAHPEGYAAFAYSLYWLIPAAVGFMRKPHLFAQALGSTFTAHAVGSVVMLYNGLLSAETLTALIPAVFIERMLFATGMVAAYYAVVGYCALRERMRYFNMSKYLLSLD